MSLNHRRNFIKCRLYVVLQYFVTDRLLAQKDEEKGLKAIFK